MSTFLSLHTIPDAVACHGYSADDDEDDESEDDDPCNDDWDATNHSKDDLCKHNCKNCGCGGGEDEEEGDVFVHLLISLSTKTSDEDGDDDDKNFPWAS